LAEGMKAARLGNAKVLDTLIANGRVEALQDQGLFSRKTRRPGYAS
jgi:hypothetical protein